MTLTVRRGASEAIQTARSSPVASVAIAAIVACMCAAVLLSAGRAAALERDVLASVDDAGTRLITISSNRNDGGLDPAVVDRIARLDGVAWVVGFGVARDLTNADLTGGSPVASRTVYGQWRSELDVTVGTPSPGTALVSATSATSLGLSQPVGAVELDDTVIPVVGQFVATGVLAPLDGFVLRVPGPHQESDPVTLVYVVAETAGQVAPLADAVVAVSGETDLDTLRVTTSDRLVDLERAISGQLGGFSRQLAVGVLAGGMVLVVLCMIMVSNSRRRDFGRRRALGASRPALVGVVALSTLLPAAAGVVAGVVAGLVLLWRQGHPLPDAAFVAAVAALTVMVTVAGALPGAVLAAWRDPAAVLRVP